jgi:hypothetical protein
MARIEPKSGKLRLIGLKKRERFSVNASGNF